MYLNGSTLKTKLFKMRCEALRMFVSFGMRCFCLHPFERLCGLPYKILLFVLTLCYFFFVIYLFIWFRGMKRLIVSVFSSLTEKDKSWQEWVKLFLKVCNCGWHWFLNTLLKVKIEYWWGQFQRAVIACGFIDVSCAVDASWESVWRVISHCVSFSLPLLFTSCYHVWTWIYDVVLDFLKILFKN